MTTIMKIREILAFGLRGHTPEGGWSNELRPEDCVHTLIAVLTSEGLTGWGSVFTSEELVRASLSVLRPLYQGENALGPERVSEKLRQHTFWLGRGGSITHTISGIDIALWDLLGKAAGQPVGRLLGGRHRERVRPYASLLMREPEKMDDELGPVEAQGFRAFKIGWGPFGRKSDAYDEAIVRAAREAVGDESLLMVDAGASDAFSTELQVGAPDSGDAGAIRRRLVRRAPASGCIGRLRESTARGQGTDLRRRSADATAGVSALARGRRI
jgi:D-galactarolactone cycloisomerase